MFLLAVGPIGCELTQPPPAVVGTVTPPLLKPESPVVEPAEIKVAAGGTTPVCVSAARADDYRWELQGVGETLRPRRGLGMTKQAAFYLGGLLSDKPLEGEIILYTAPQQC